MAKYQDRTDYLICLLLVIATLAIYLQVRSFGFVTVDDDSYVISNRHVLGGVTLGAVSWAFTTHLQSNWHPLTWISLMVDAALGKANPGVFHLTNLAFHVFNTLLLFVLLHSTTRFRWRSAAVAALFALHPLHVESVAWVSERKDVLSALLWLLTMLAYVWYAKAPSVRRYLLMLMSFALGLMAKPVVVSLPLVLLLMDIWPLRRAEPKSDASSSIRFWWPLIREKIPMFVMAALSCGVTYWAQAAGRSVADEAACPIGARVANALVSYASYVIKMVCPLNLSMFYPHPVTSLPVWQVIAAGLFFALMLVIAIKSVRRLPFITVGWLWYVLTLIPMIGLVQVGQQSMADRYTYLPLIGLFIILAWGVPELLNTVGAASGRLNKPSPVLPALGVVLLVGLMACTYFQVSYWRDSIGLFEHATTVDEYNYLAHFGLGGAFAVADRNQEAVAEYMIALKLCPGLAQAHYNLGMLLLKIGKFQGAAAHFAVVLQSMPDDPEVNSHLGIALVRLGRVDEA